MVRLEEDGGFTLNQSYFRHHNEKISYEWSGGEPSVGELFREEMLEDLLGVPARRREDLLEQ